MGSSAGFWQTIQTRYVCETSMDDRANSFCIPFPSSNASSIIALLIGRPDLSCFCPKSCRRCLPLVACLNAAIHSSNIYMCASCVIPLPPLPYAYSLIYIACSAGSMVWFPKSRVDCAHQQKSTHTFKPGQIYVLDMELGSA